MSSHEYVTVDVFTDRPFAGNPLAVFPEAHGIPASALLPITRQFGFSETVFVLPGDRADQAQVRIFTLDGEADFAGHPLVGTACVLAERTGQAELLLDVPAGTSTVQVETAETGLRRATVTTPQPLEVQGTAPTDLVADALSLTTGSVLTENHGPTVCGMGRPYVITEVTAEALDQAVPDTGAFARAQEATAASRFGVLVYARAGAGQARARMFAPLTGTIEDPATGSANVALAGLLLSLDAQRDELHLTVCQGEVMGRPSTLDLHAWTEGSQIRASVSGTVVPVMQGRLSLPPTDGAARA